MSSFLLGARMMYALDQSRQEESIKLATTLEKVEGINIKVQNLTSATSDIVSHLFLQL